LFCSQHNIIYFYARLQVSICNDLIKELDVRGFSCHGLGAGLSNESSEVQIPHPRAEIWFEISAPPALPKKIGYDEYTDHTLSVAR